MLEKDKYLEKINYLIFLVIILFSQGLIAETLKLKIIKYNNDLKNSSALFLQNDGDSLEEGIIYFGIDRIKIDYTKPIKLTLILSEKKGIYTNHELRESQYFNTNKSYIKVFFKILKGDNFLDKPKMLENFVELNHDFSLNNNIYKIKIIYEYDPIKLRKIIILENNQKIEMGFYNHNNLETYEKKFFSMINPYLD
ncbi:MAG: hypothetical protein HOF20_03105 [Pelagibacteraceae bacterium]|jgi:hypothetical protein|nr:hypothetical protein [Pelagibacteraceae bacterium]MBT4646567.1 hypothetical protein [Pelagibacteraceae bacterium]MBT5213011.1 hypothetical protein [Pelagibacteraceae bacterium]